MEMARFYSWLAETKFWRFGQFFALAVALGRSRSVIIVLV